MKVLLRKNINKLGIIGDVVEVKNGYGRNYLVPQGLGVEPTEANIKAVEADKARYLEELAKQRVALEERAKAVDGKEITITSRANEEGHLYGSVGPAQIVALLAEENLFVNEEEIILAEPIRQLDKYDIAIKFSDDIKATITVWIVPLREVEEEDQDPAPAEVETESADDETDAE